MNPAVEQAVKDYFARSTSHSGKILTPAALQELQAKLTVPLADWHLELLSTFPLAGTFMDYPVHEREGDDDGYISLRIARARDIYSETEECYPGIALQKRGYACLATDPTGGGDPYFMKISDGDNPAVYQVYHDVSQDGEVIERDGMNKIANLLSEFFEKARPDPYVNPYENH